MNRLFAQNDNFDIKAGNVTQTLQNESGIDSGIKSILRNLPLKHPLQFFNVDFDISGTNSEILDRLSAERNIPEYLTNNYRDDEVRTEIVNAYTRIGGNIESIDLESSLINIKQAIIDFTEIYINEYSRTVQLTDDLRTMSRHNRDQYLEYHRKTIPHKEVKGVNDQILDLQNYETNRIQEILKNNSGYDKRDTIFDKKLSEIIDDTINFFVFIPEKYSEYLAKSSTESTFTKHLISIVSLIIDKDNSIYIGLYLFIISIILYTINIIIE